MQRKEKKKKVGAGVAAVAAKGHQGSPKSQASISFFRSGEPGHVRAGWDDGAAPAAASSSSSYCLDERPHVASCIYLGLSNWTDVTL